MDWTKVYYIMGIGIDFKKCDAVEGKEGIAAKVEAMKALPEVQLVNVWPDSEYNPDDYRETHVYRTTTWNHKTNSWNGEWQRDE